MMKGLEAVVFDLDGVLADTAMAHANSWVEVAKSAGIELTLPQADAFRGIPRVVALERIIGGNKQISRQMKLALLEMKGELYRKEISRMGPATLVDGAPELLEGLRSIGIPLAVASASKHAELVLEMTGVRHLFLAVSDGYFNGGQKPDPGQLLSLAYEIGLKRESTVVVEDSMAGLLAAKRAGMAGLAVGHAAAGCETAIAAIDSLAGYRAREFVELISASMSCKLAGRVS